MHNTADRAMHSMCEVHFCVRRVAAYQLSANQLQSAIGAGFKSRQI